MIVAVALLGYAALLLTAGAAALARARWADRRRGWRSPPGWR